MRAILNIAARLHEGEVGKPQDWRPLYDKVNDRPVPWWKRSVPVDRAVLSDVLGEWLNIAHVRLECHWSGEKPAIHIATQALFGALVVQLALAISRTDGLAVCSGCGLSYVPSRRPRETKRRYCPECRKRKVPGRDAATDYQRRKAQAHRLAAEGRSLRTIAKDLNITMSKARRWVGTSRRRAG